MGFVYTFSYANVKSHATKAGAAGQTGAREATVCFHTRVWKVLVIINVLLLAALCRCTYEQAAETMVQPGKRGTSRQRAFAIRGPFLLMKPNAIVLEIRTPARKQLHGETVKQQLHIQTTIRLLCITWDICYFVPGAAAATFSLQQQQKEKKNIMPIRSAASIPPNV